MNPSGKDNIMQLKCRIPESSPDDPEDLLRIFLLDSFESKYMYIISPWISSFKLSKKLIYYPYVSSSSIADVLRTLHDIGVNVRVLARCFDDFLSPSLVYILCLIYEKKLSVPQDVAIYLREQLESMIQRLEIIESILDTGIDFRTDLGVSNGSWYRLHAKIYVNERWALIGSANFSRAGMVRGGNWECLLLVHPSSGLYGEILSYARKLFQISKSYSECELRILKYFKKYGINVHSLDDLKMLLKELYKTL